MRTDAAENRARILASARRLLGEHGVAVPMDAIARDAGVAVGTLYRHFPTKTHLVLAAVEASVDRVADAADAAVAGVRGGADACGALADLFRQVAASYAVDHALKAAAQALGATPLDLGTAKTGSAAARAGAALGDLLAAAQADGGVRPDLTPGDLVLLLSRVPDAGEGEDQRARYVELVIAGLGRGPRGAS